MAGSCVLGGRWQALSTRHKGLAQEPALGLPDRAIEIPSEMQADVMVSSTHRKQYASRIFKKSPCVQTRSRHRLKNASAQLLCNSSRARPGSSPSPLRQPQHRYFGVQLSHQQVKNTNGRYKVETWYPNTCPPHKQRKIAACNCYLDLGQSAFAVNDKTAPRKERGGCVISCFLLQASYVPGFKKSVATTQEYLLAQFCSKYSNQSPYPTIRKVNTLPRGCKSGYATLIASLGLLIPNTSKRA